MYNSPSSRCGWLLLEPKDDFLDRPGEGLMHSAIACSNSCLVLAEIRYPSKSSRAVSSRYFSRGSLALDKVSWPSLVAQPPQLFF